VPSGRLFIALFRDLLTILLDTRRAQARKPMLVD
jgi:hypothetical protein